MGGYLAQYTATAQAQIPANAYIRPFISWCKPHEFGEMFTTAVQSGTDTTFGRTGKKTVLNAGPYGYCVSPSIHHLHNFLHLSHSVYVCIFSKHHSVYVKCKLLYLEKLTCFYFTPHWLRLHTSGTDFQNFMNIILFHTDQDFGKKHCLIL